MDGASAGLESLLPMGRSFFTLRQILRGSSDARLALQYPFLHVDVNAPQITPLIEQHGLPAGMAFALDDRHQLHDAAQRSGGGLRYHAPQGRGFDHHLRGARGVCRWSRVRPVCGFEIVPGTIDTVGNREAMPDVDRKGWVAPERIARVIAYLCGPDSIDVNGSTFLIKGSA